MTINTHTSCIRIPVHHAQIQHDIADMIVLNENLGHKLNSKWTSYVLWLLWRHWSCYNGQIYISILIPTRVTTTNSQTLNTDSWSIVLESDCGGYTHVELNHTSGKHYNFRVSSVSETIRCRFYKMPFSATPGPPFTNKTPSYGYRDAHDKPKTVWRPSQVYNGNPYTDKTASS